MTDREKAIVMAYTGVVTLEGDKLGIYYDYVAELMGRRIATHEIPILLKNIKARACSDFRRICEATDSPARHGEWIEKPYLLGTTRYCSRCNVNYGMPHGVFKYCPNCGAKMDGGKSE